MQTARRAPLTGQPAAGGRHRRRRAAVLLAIAAVVVALDQLTKILAVEYLAGGRVVEVIDGVLQLRLVRNPGAAFSVATNFTVVLALVAVAVVIVILRLSRRLSNTPWAVALGGLLGGAVGNLVDRLFRDPGPLRGHVIDFLELPRWPVFNLADSAIVGSAVLIAVLSLRGVPYDGRRDRSGDVDGSAGEPGPPDDAAPGADGPSTRHGERDE